MSWSLKVALLQRAGRSKEEALIEVAQELDAKVKALDERLAASFEFLTADQIDSVIGGSLS